MKNKCLKFKRIYKFDKNKDNFSIALFIESSELAHENLKYPSPNSPNDVPAMAAIPATSNNLFWNSKELKFNFDDDSYILPHTNIILDFERPKSLEEKIGGA